MESQVCGLTVDVANTEAPFLDLSVAGISALTVFFGVTDKLELASGSGGGGRTLVVSGVIGACGLVAGQVSRHGAALFACCIPRMCL